MKKSRKITKHLTRDAGGIKIASSFSQDADATIFNGSCQDLLQEIPDASVQLVVTSPPYNIGKSYEKVISLETYVAQQEEIIRECVRVLNKTGSICWEVGNYIGEDEIVPLDIVLFPIFAKYGLKLRNRIVWHFEHGLHCRKRFSGRYETILWLTKSNDYVFNLDAVRVPQKYPNKRYYKGPKTGELSCNPLGKNPGDIWSIPNVKHNHVEKTIHPCQFPVELVERLILALTNPGDLVLDPFLGVGSTAVAAIKNRRRAAGADIIRKYADIATDRVRLAFAGKLRTRPMNTPIYTPGGFKKEGHNYKSKCDPNQLALLEKKVGYAERILKEVVHA
jgi:adenine-specific DNA-methyltransferase